MLEITYMGFKIQANVELTTEHGFRGEYTVTPQDQAMVMRLEALHLDKFFSRVIVESTLPAIDDMAGWAIKDLMARARSDIDAIVKKI